MKAYFLWLAKLVTLVVIVFFVLGGLGAILSGKVSKDLKDGNDDKYMVAVIELKGVIEDAKDTLIALRKQVKNDKVKGIVLRIDSPGGAVGASQDLYYGIKELRKQKPIVASLGNVAASGGFYTAMAATKIVTQPGTLTGSIGVIMQLPNYSKIADKVGVSFVTIKSGKFKDIGNAFRTITEDEKKVLEANVLDVQDQFVSAVAESRGLTVENVKKFADGRVFSGRQALEYGVVDKLGDMYTAARLVFEEIGEPVPADTIPTLYFPAEKYEKLMQIFESVKSLLNPYISFTNSQRVKLYYML
jgi:protease-4